MTEGGRGWWREDRSDGKQGKEKDGTEEVEGRVGKAYGRTEERCGGGGRDSRCWVG